MAGRDRRRGREFVVVFGSAADERSNANPSCRVRRVVSHDPRRLVGRGGRPERILQYRAGHADRDGCGRVEALRPLRPRCRPGRVRVDRRRPEARRASTSTDVSTTRSTRPRSSTSPRRRPSCQAVGTCSCSRSTQPGCWELSASIGDRVVGTATVLVAPEFPEPSGPVQSAPAPTEAPVTVPPTPALGINRRQPHRVGPGLPIRRRLRLLPRTRGGGPPRSREAVRALRRISGPDDPVTHYELELDRAIDPLVAGNYTVTLTSFRYADVLSSERAARCGADGILLDRCSGCTLALPAS